jgi:hypothetical protein
MHHCEIHVLFGKKNFTNNPKTLHANVSKRSHVDVQLELQLLLELLLVVCFLPWRKLPHGKQIVIILIFQIRIVYSGL